MLAAKNRPLRRHRLRDRERPSRPFNAKESRRRLNLLFPVKPTRVPEAAERQIEALLQKKPFAPRAQWD